MTTLRSGTSEDDVGAVDDPCRSQPLQLIYCLFGCIALVHVSECFIQSAFHPDVEFIDPKSTQPPQLFVFFRRVGRR
jgi:hypothetical protein